jgi:hypothetical protein
MLNIAISPLTILNENDNKIKQPNGIKIELFDHQKTIIYKLIEREEEKKIIINNYENNKDCMAIIDTDKIILCDKVGSGKTLEIIGLQIIKNFVSEEPDIDSFDYFAIEKKNNEIYKLNIDLVIIPHILIDQWKNTYEKYTNLKVLVIDNIDIVNNLIEREWKIDHVNDLNNVILYINKKIELEHIINYDVILLSDIMWEKFFEVMYVIRWRRVIIDEADTINYPEDAKLNGNIKYFITGTPHGLINNKSKYLNDIFIDKDSIEFINYLSIKNDDKYINKSIKLIKPNRIKIKCLTPKELYIIHDIIPPEILQMINAGNTEDAIMALNCEVNTSNNIIKILTLEINKKIVELEFELKYESNNELKYDFNKILKIKEKLKKLYLKIETIKDRISKYKDEMCPICFDNFSNPCVISCCKILICYECLIMSSNETNKCPNCTSSFKKENIKVINENVNIQKEKIINILENKMDKMYIMLDIIDKKKNGNFLIFANFEETLYKIENKFKELNIDYKKLDNNYSDKDEIIKIKNYIENYNNKNNKCNILLLNAKYYGSGLNLQTTTDIIMFHRFNKNTEEQIIGRAQRIGREYELNVYYLLHDNEDNIIDDNFEFNDITNFNYTDWILLKN